MVTSGGWGALWAGRSLPGTGEQGFCVSHVTDPAAAARPPLPSCSRCAVDRQQAGHPREVAPPSAPQPGQSPRLSYCPTSMGSAPCLGSTQDVTSS